MVFSGINPDSNLVEIIEYIDHPFFVASQFHPEFKSRPDHAHPLFSDFIEAAYKNSQHVLAKSSNKLENKVSY
jgi:CTP synthase